MSWYKLYKQAQSDMDYGAWVAPSGEIIVVRDYGHLKEGRKLLKERHNIETEPDAGDYVVYGKMFDIGYVRLVFISFNCQFKTMTHSQKRKLGGIIQQSQSPSFTFESNSDRDKSGHAYNKIEAMRILRAI
jgi:hypothetical protein